VRLGERFCKFPSDDAIDVGTGHHAIHADVDDGTAYDEP